MKRWLLLVMFPAFAVTAYCQGSGVYNTGYTAVKNLEAVANSEAYSDGGIGFDNRYKGVKGSKYLLDTLTQSYLRLKDMDEWVDLMVNLDVFDNRLIFKHPGSGELQWIPADMVAELVVLSGGNKLMFRTTDGMNFEKKEEKIKFCQVMYDSIYCFIKVPYKKFTEANYKALYSPQILYDEYESKSKYYISDADSVFHQVSLSRKSLLKSFPGQGEFIAACDEKLYPDPEQYVLAVVRKFR
jgi:hypothetical protein